MSIKNKKIGVILMTYGSPKTLKDVPNYLKNVYGGKDAKPEVIKEFQRRYKLINGSPLIQITKKQAQALQKELNSQNIKKYQFKVEAGMRFSKPFIKNVAEKIANGTNYILGIIMSPQYSPIIMEGYIKTLEKAVSTLNRKDLKLKIARDWHLQKYFIKALAIRVRQALNKLPKNVQDSVTILFSAHSMPKRVIEKEPNYVKDLRQTASAVAKEAGLPKRQWMFCYQSAGHTPEKWLKPDFADIMPKLQEKGQKNVIIAPVQFLSDHLEILYDVGIAAKKQAEEHGIKFTRTKSLNTHPLFIKALAEVVKKTINYST